MPPSRRPADRASASRPRPAAATRAKRVLFVDRARYHARLADGHDVGAAPGATASSTRGPGASLYRRSLSVRRRADGATGTRTAAAETSATRASRSGTSRSTSHGGTPTRSNFTDRGWLAPQREDAVGQQLARLLRRQRRQHAERRPRRSTRSRRHAGTTRSSRSTWPSVSFCDNPYPCSWDPNKPFSWQTNRAQNATQVFFFVNNWHDHLRGAPIGFTEAAGNFQNVNSTGQGKGGDAGRHADRRRRRTPTTACRTATTSTTPTWTRRRTASRRRCRCTCSTSPARRTRTSDPFVADQRRRRGRHRLPRVHPRPVQPAGRRRQRQLDARRRPGRRDGRGVERLVRHGLPRRPGPADATSRGTADIVHLPVRRRRAPASTAPSRSTARSARLATAARRRHRRTRGGYTYARLRPGHRQPRGARRRRDLGADPVGPARPRSARSVDRVAGDPGDGAVADATRRSSTAQRDPAGRHRGRTAAATTSTIWSVFAHRGMGFFAGALGGDDAAPGADFHDAAGATSTGLHHRHGDRRRHRRAGAPASPVTLGLPGRLRAREPVRRSPAADGRYSIGPVPVGHYREARPSSGPATTRRPARRHGRQGRRRSQDFAIRRDWAALERRRADRRLQRPGLLARLRSRQARSTRARPRGWGSTTGDDDGRPDEHVRPEVHRGRRCANAVDIAEFAVDPSATCGDGRQRVDGRASRSRRRRTASTWTQVASGRRSPMADRRPAQRRSTPTAAANGVQYVRFTITRQPDPGLRDQLPGRRVLGLLVHRPDRARGVRRGELTVRAGRPDPDVARYLSTRGAASATRSSTWSRRGNRSRRVVSARNIAVTVTSWPRAVKDHPVASSPVCSTPSWTTRR